MGGGRSSLSRSVFVLDHTPPAYPTHPPPTPPNFLPNAMFGIFCRHRRRLCRHKSKNPKIVRWCLSQIKGLGPSGVLPLESSRKMSMNAESFSPYSPIFVPIVLGSPPSHSSVSPSHSRGFPIPSHSRGPPPILGDPPLSHSRGPPKF